jgi:surface antigen
MLVSMVEFIDVLMEKRRSVIAVGTVIISLLFFVIIAPILQAHRTSITSHLQTSYTNEETPGVYDSPNAVTNAMSQIADDTGRATNGAEIKTVGAVMGAAGGVTDIDKAIAHGTYVGTTDTVHGIGTGTMTVAHGVGDGFDFIGHIGGNIFGLFSGATHVGALIRPTDHTPTPTITQMRAQQATIIQSGTKGVSLAPISSGTGGACDIGEGNGGYPIGWCNASMDTIATIGYSSDAINRECTSYAYWYFTAIEGHTDFRAWDDAKYWATTSNYPTHTTPAVGAIAVETAGAYGHVAIVQALPGQSYEGQVVPAGYVLVSEMNYDWGGHFRYSYSPLSKFSTYIYH